MKDKKSWFYLEMDGVIHWSKLPNYVCEGDPMKLKVGIYYQGTKR